jgi:Bifunctional DNA primase/polymerase, N-terminal/CHC2 zinc finger
LRTVPGTRDAYQQARAALLRGWAPIPIEPGGKRPLVTWHQYQERRPTAAEVRHWWRRRWPDAGLGIVTGQISGLVVLDVDPRNGGDETLVELERQHGPLPATVEVLTGGGGRHAYFRHPGGQVAPAKVGPGLDLLGDGSLVIAPPSIHPSGQPYAWELSSEPGTVALAELPAWLRQGATASRGTPPGGGAVRPSRSREQAEFADRWAGLGLTLRPGDQLYLCPFHPDRATPSLHVDADRCIWWCFGCKRGGGLRRLRELLEPDPTPDGRGSEQGKCPNISVSDDPPPTDVEALGHCGRSMLLRRRDDPGAGLLMRLFCKRKACPGCGPRLRAKYAAHFTAATAGRTLYRVPVARGSWATMAKRLRRAAADYVRVPAPDGRYTVFATVGPGELVAEPAAALAEAFNFMPSDLARVSSTRAWRISSPETAGAWELVGLVKVGTDRAAAVARHLGILRGPVAAGMLPPAVAEAWALTLPADDGPEFERFARLVGLHDPPDRWSLRGAA